MLQEAPVNFRAGEGGETMFGENHSPHPLCILGD